MINKTSNSPSETAKIASSIAKKCPKGGVICLYGELGAGKTVFVKGFAEQLGIKPKEVKSPTYTFLRSYKLKNKYLHHFDFYRIEKIDDLLRNDVEELLQNTKNWILIEWPERIEEILPKERTNIFLKYIDPNTREITIKNG